MFFEVLNTACKERNTTPSAVALAIGISKSNVTEWKKGRSPKLDTVVAIARHLGMSPADLIPKDTGEEQEAS